MAERPDPSKFNWRAFTPEDSPRTPVDLMADPKSQDLRTPKLGPGDPAHPFARPLFDYAEGKGRATGETFDLLDACREKPVALIFGSYT